MPIRQTEFLGRLQTGSWYSICEGREVCVRGKMERPACSEPASHGHHRASGGCANSKWGLLNGIREAASRNFRTDGVSNLLVLEVFRTLAYMKLDVVALVIFYGVGVALDLFDCAVERPPCRTRLFIMRGYGLGRCFRRRVGGFFFFFLLFRVLGQRWSQCQRNNGDSSDQNRENLLVWLLHQRTSFERDGHC